MDVNSIDVTIGAVVMPNVIAVLNQRRWSAPVKAAVALAACLLMALLLEVMRGPVTGGEWRDTALVVAGTAFAAYRLYWRPSGIAPAVEDATSLPAGRDGTDHGSGQHQAGAQY